MPSCCPFAFWCLLSLLEPPLTPASDHGDITGESACSPCPVGGYCPTAGANSVRLVFQPCPAGYFNPSSGALAADACLPCPPGTASTAVQVPSRFAVEASATARDGPLEERVFATATVDQHIINTSTVAASENESLGNPGQ